MTTIEEFAFYACTSLTNITIGRLVTNIGKEAFEYCYRLIEVYNKSSLSLTVGSHDNGFVACFAKNVYTTEGGSKLSTDENGYVIYIDGREEILVAYHGTNTELILPTYITQINQYAFYKCSNLTRVTILDYVQKIGLFAFEYCTGLTSVTIGLDVTSIGEYAFEYCYRLVEVYNRSSLSIKAGSLSNGFVAYYARNVYT